MQFLVDILVTASNLVQADERVPRYEPSKSGSFSIDGKGAA